MLAAAVKCEICYRYWFRLGEIRKENWLLEVGAADDGYAEPMKLQHCKVYVHSKEHMMGGRLSSVFYNSTVWSIPEFLRAGRGR